MKTIYLGAKIINKTDPKPEIIGRIEMTNEAMGKLKKVWKVPTSALKHNENNVVCGFSNSANKNYMSS